MKGETHETTAVLWGHPPRLVHLMPTAPCRKAGTWVPPEYLDDPVLAPPAGDFWWYSFVISVVFPGLAVGAETRLSNLTTDETNPGGGRSCWKEQLGSLSGPHRPFSTSKFLWKRGPSSTLANSFHQRAAPALSRSGQAAHRRTLQLGAAAADLLTGSGRFPLGGHCSVETGDADRLGGAVPGRARSGHPQLLAGSDPDLLLRGPARPDADRRQRWDRAPRSADDHARSAGFGRVDAADALGHDRRNGHGLRFAPRGRRGCANRRSSGAMRCVTRCCRSRPSSASRLAT